MTRFLALLRGINVGGKNIIAMKALKACFEDLGFDAVVTYIQSGNVIFGASGSAGALTRRIEEALGETFGYEATVVLRSRKQLEDIVTRAPRGFGSEPTKHRYDVIFLKAPVTAAAAMKSVIGKDGVDAVHPGGGVLYFSRLISRATESRLSRIVTLPVYQSMTIRNWNTTTKLLDLMSPGSV